MSVNKLEDILNFQDIDDYQDHQEQSLILLKMVTIIFKIRDYLMFIIHLVETDVVNYKIMNGECLSFTSEVNKEKNMILNISELVT